MSLSETSARRSRVGTFAAEFCRVRVILLLVFLLPGGVEIGMEAQTKNQYLTTHHFVRDIANHPAFKGFGELILPWDDNSRYYDTRLDHVSALMPYHGHVNGDVIVGALNFLITERNAGQTIFYDFYTEQQKQNDPSKRFTGLFFYRAKPGTPFAIICPGGGFSYVGSLHEGFPLAREISERGLNAFVIRYRVGEQRATEDLAAAIAFVLRNSAMLGVAAHGYSLWGSSAGARMVGNIALRGVSAYGGEDLSRPSTVVISYTGQTIYSKDFPPTFITVSSDDPIADVATVERRVRNLRNVGVEVEYHRYSHAGHGFGLGVGTDAEGWLGIAVDFWKKTLIRTKGSGPAYEH
jgi:acetyl esterase/lipase